MFHNDENGARPIGEKYTSGIEPTRDFLENKIGLTPDEATRHIAEAESSVSGTAFLEIFQSRKPNAKHCCARKPWQSAKPSVKRKAQPRSRVKNNAVRRHRQKWRAL